MKKKSKKKKTSRRPEKKQLIQQIKRKTRLYDDIDLTGASYAELLRVKALHEGSTLKVVHHPRGRYNDYNYT